MINRTRILAVAHAAVFALVAISTITNVGLVRGTQGNPQLPSPEPYRILKVDRNSHSYEIRIFEAPLAVENQIAEFNKLVSRAEQNVLNYIDDGTKQVRGYEWDMLRRERPATLSAKLDELFSGEPADIDKQIRAFDYFAAYDPDRAIQWAIKMLQPSTPAEKRFVILYRLADLNGWRRYGALGIEQKIPWSSDLWATLLEMHAPVSFKQDPYQKRIYPRLILDEIDCPEMRVALSQLPNQAEELSYYRDFLTWAAANISEPWVLDRIKSLIAKSPFPVPKAASVEQQAAWKFLLSIERVPRFADQDTAWNALLTLAACCENREICDEATTLILDAIRTSPQSLSELDAALRRGLTVPLDELNSYRDKLLEKLSTSEPHERRRFRTELLGRLFRGTNNSVIFDELRSRLRRLDSQPTWWSPEAPNLEIMLSLALVVGEADRQLPSWDNAALGEVPLAMTEIMWRKNKVTYQQFLAKLNEFELGLELTPETVPASLERRLRQSGYTWRYKTAEFAHDEFCAYELITGTLYELKLCDLFASEHLLLNDFWKMSTISRGHFLPGHMTMFGTPDDRLDLRFTLRDRLYSVEFQDTSGRPTSTFFPIANAILEDLDVDWMFCQIEGRPEIAFLSSTSPTCLFAPRKLVESLEREFGLVIILR